MSQKLTYDMTRTGFPGTSHIKSPTLRAMIAQAEAFKTATKSKTANPAEPVEVYGFAPAGKEAALVAIPHPNPAPSQHPSKRPTNQPTPSTPTARPHANSNLRNKRLEKLERSFVAAHKLGGIAFTLKFSAKRRATFEKHPDPARLMSHYINREFKAAGLIVPYAFTFEVSPGGFLHLHGVVIPNSLGLGHLNAIDCALARAGGKLKGQRITRNTQSYLALLYDGAGWFNYLQKDWNRTTHFLGTNKITFISAELTKLVNSAPKAPQKPIQSHQPSKQPSTAQPAKRAQRPFLTLLQHPKPSPAPRLLHSSYEVTCCLPQR